MNLIDSRVGSQDFGNGIVAPLRSGHGADLLLNEALGQYYEVVKQGKVFCASMQAGAAFGTVLSDATVPITLFNPGASNVNLVVLASTFAMTASQTTTTNAPTVVYTANFSLTAAAVTGTAITVRKALLGPGVGEGLAFSVATLPAEGVVVRVFPWGHRCLLTTATERRQSSATDYVDGAIVLRPNTAISLQGLAATTGITGIASILWAEIPI